MLTATRAYLGAPTLPVINSQQSQDFPVAKSQHGAYSGVPRRHILFTG